MRSLQRNYEVIPNWEIFETGPLTVPTILQNTRYARAAVRVNFSYTGRSYERVVPIAIIRKQFSVSKLKSPSRLPRNYRNAELAGTRVADF